MVFSFQTSSDLMNWRTLDFTNSPSGVATFADNYLAPATASSSNRYYRGRLDAPNTTVVVTNYHNWSNCLLLRNGVAEVDIVPAIGRIMQFRFLGATNGPFFENTNMFGQQPSATQWNTAGAFGGDKVWPSPQSAWPAANPSGVFQPPRAFDSTNFWAEVVNDTVVMTGPVDATIYGMYEVRSISLHPTEAIMRVTSAFVKTTGANVTTGVWSITQVQDAQEVFVPVPQQTVFPPLGYTTALGSVPPSLTVSNGLISFVRPAAEDTKIGNDAGALLWVGANSALLIESARIPGALKSSYPDGGCSAEVYTDENPTPYIEMEILAPMVALSTNLTNSSVTSIATANTVYSLLYRTQPTPAAEADKYLLR